MLLIIWIEVIIYYLKCVWAWCYNDIVWDVIPTIFWEVKTRNCTGADILDNNMRNKKRVLFARWRGRQRNSLEWSVTSVKVLYRFGPRLTCEPCLLVYTVMNLYIHVFNRHQLDSCFIKNIRETRYKYMEKKIIILQISFSILSIWAN